MGNRLRSRLAFRLEYSLRAIRFSLRKVPLLAASKGGHIMFHRIFVGALVLAATLSMASTASAFDESKYPDFQGQWKRKLATINSWDETRRPGLPHDPPLTSKYRQRW